jgi:hypothetical protein
MGFVLGVNIGFWGFGHSFFPNLGIIIKNQTMCEFDPLCQNLKNQVCQAQTEQENISWYAILTVPWGLYSTGGLKLTSPKNMYHQIFVVQWLLKPYINQNFEFKS